MATITTQDVKQIIEDGFYLPGQTHGMTKAQQVTLEQDLENWFESQRTTLVNGLNTRAAQFGVVFSGADKKRIVRNFLRRKFKREGG